MSRDLKHFYEFGGFRLEPGERPLLRAGEAVPLTPKALTVLCYLLAHPHRMVGREQALGRLPAA